MIEAQEMYTDRMVPAIIGIGSAVGSVQKTNADIIGDIVAFDEEKWSGRKNVLEKLLTSRIGIHSRNWVADDEATSDMAIKATEKALAMSGIAKDRVGSIILATSSPDNQGVPTAPIIQDRLGFPNEIQAYDIDAACPGFIHALRNAYYDVTHPLWDGKARIIGGVETISRYLDPSFVDSYILFGDAAGAAVVDLIRADEGAPTAWWFEFGSDGSHKDDITLVAGGTRMPPTEETVRLRLHTLTLNGQVVKREAEDKMPKLVRNVLDKTGYPIEDVILVPHQANLGIIKNVGETLNIPMERVIVTIGEFGNTSSASIPTALDIAVSTGKVKRNDVVVFCSFGAGFGYGAGVIPMSGIPREGKTLFQAAV